MANLLEWTFKLNDKFSGPAKDMSAGIGDFLQNAHSALAVTQMVGQAFVATGRAAASTFEAMVSPAVNMEKTLGAFETLLGSASKASEMYEQAVQFASATPFQTPEVVKGFQSLLTAHIKPVEVPVAMTIIGDATSMSANAAEALNSVTMQLGQMRSLGRVTMEDLKPIMQATMMDGQRYSKNLAAYYGKSVAEVTAMQAKGQVDAESGTYVILQTLQQQFEGNMQRASKQVQGLWSTIESYPEQYLTSLMKTEGYEKMRGALVNIADTFDPINGKGKVLMATVKEFGGGIIERVFGPLSGDEGAKNTEAVLTSVNELLEDVEAAAFGLSDGFAAGFGTVNQLDASMSSHEQTMQNFKVTMEAIGLVLGVTAGAIKVVSGALGTMYGWLESVGDWTTEHPVLFRMMTATVGAVGGGLAGGAAGLATMGPAGALLGLVGGAAAGGVAGGLAPEIIGAAAGAGVTNTTGTSVGTTQEMLLSQVPHFGTGGVVYGPTLALIGESGPEAVVPLNRPWSESGGSSSAGGAPNVSVSFEYHAGSGMISSGGSKEDAQDIQRLVEAGVLQALDRWQLQAGR